MKIQTLKGMQDILPSDIGLWQEAEKLLSQIASAYGYEEIRTPILEPLELYARGVGEHTDIVQKEMFAFKDQGGVHMCARPEATASIVRSYLQHSMDQNKPITKLFYIGPLFRHERPQKGRYRQFHQFGAEVLGKRSPSLDVELILMMDSIARAFSLSNPKLEINSLGDTASRKNYRSILQTYFQQFESDLNDNEKTRLQENPLRLLDSKNPALKDAIAQAPSILDHLNDESKKFFDQVVEGLQSNNVNFSVNPAIVRGMDYYCDTAFELKVDGLGAQDTVIGGGRYDGLSQQLGGHDVPASGFAMGMERLLLSAKELQIPQSQNILVLPLGTTFENKALQLAQILRDHANKSHIHFLSNINSLKSGLRAANKYNADHVLIIGESESNNNLVMWKNFDTGEQVEVALDEVTTTLKDFL